MGRREKSEELGEGRLMSVRVGKDRLGRGFGREVIILRWNGGAL